MTKTSQDVTNEALRMIGVLAVDEAATADDHARAKSHLEAFFAEIDETYGVAPEWTIETVPDRLWPAVSMVVAAEICTAYGKPEFTTLRRAGMARLMRDEMGGEPQRATEAQYF